MAASHAFHLSEVISNICGPWCFTTAGRRWNVMLSLPDLLEQPTIAQMTIVITKNEPYQYNLNKTRDHIHHMFNNMVAVVVKGTS